MNFRTNAPTLHSLGKVLEDGYKKYSIRSRLCCLSLVPFNRCVALPIRSGPQSVVCKVSFAVVMSALACSMSMLGWVPSLTHRMQLFPGAVAVLKWSIYLNRITPDLYASNKSEVKSVSFP